MTTDMSEVQARQRTEPLASLRHEGIRGRRGWLVRRALLLADLVGLVTAYLLAVLLFREESVASSSTGVAAEFVLFCASLPVWVVASKLYGLYDRDEERTDNSTVDDITGVVQVVTLGTWALFVFSWLTHSGTLDVPKLTSFWVFSILLVIGARSFARSFCRRSASYIQNTVLVGGDPVGQVIASKLLRHPEYGVHLVGFVDREAVQLRPDLDALPYLGPPARLPELVPELDIERVVFAFPHGPDEETLDLIRVLNDMNVQIDITPRLSEILGPSVRIHTVEGLPLVGLPRLRLARSSNLLKKVFDTCASAAALTLLAPLFVVIALSIKVTSRGPVFFRQVRIGTGGEPFTIYKFRTMLADADAQKARLNHLNKHASRDARMFKIVRDPRVTRVGRFLRRYSLDELPQLFNVIRGEMSVVGPRPLIPEEHRFVEKWAQKRIALKPGITGLWQVLGRSEVPFEEMVKLDYLYVTGWSLSGDLKLIGRTLRTVFRAVDD